MYTYYQDTGIMIRTADGQFVQPQVDPVATAEYQAWLSAGGVPVIIDVMPIEVI